MAQQSVPGAPREAWRSTVQYKNGLKWITSTTVNQSNRPDPICSDEKVVLFMDLIPCQTSLHNQSLFFLIPFVLDIPEILLDGTGSTYCHLPKMSP